MTEVTKVLKIDEELSIEITDEKFLELQTLNITIKEDKEKFRAKVFQITDKNIFIVADEKLFEDVNNDK